VDPEAYDAYLRGRYHLNRRPTELAKAVQCFQAAIAQDSTYVAAYAGLADCLCGLSAWGVVPASEGSIKAKALALKAPELDHGSAEAHVSLAFAAMYHYDFLTAEKNFERALELNPKYGLAHQRFGWYLCVVDHYEEALRRVSTGHSSGSPVQPSSCDVGFCFSLCAPIRSSPQTVCQNPRAGSDLGSRAIRTWVGISL